MAKDRSELSRSLGVGDAIMVGLGSMLGAGVFAAVGPAAAAAGAGLLPGLALAAAVAYCNATSSAQLAALYPESGGTYVYAARRLGHLWGYLAGWAFVVGKTASCAAMAFTFGVYAAPSLARPVAVAAVIALTMVNVLGVRKTALLTRLIVAVVLAALALVVVGALGGGQVAVGNLATWSGRPGDILEAGGLLFFAFAGYARIATLGEEVVDPTRTIPKAIPRALGIVLGVYLLVMLSALLAAGPQTLADAAAPLVAAVQAGNLDALAPAVRVGGTVAAVGVLLSLLAGITRTSFAMARNGDLPRFLAAVQPRTRVPHVAQLGLGALVVVVVLVADLRGAIGFSSFGVLTYYGLANASAWTLRGNERRWPRWIAIAGVAGCALLALSLPLASVLAGAAMLAVGLVAFLLSSSPRRRPPDARHV